MRSHELLVGSVLLYPTAQNTDADREASTVIWHSLKQGSASTISAVAEAAWKHSRPGEPLESLFKEESIFVPAPSSSVHRDDALWVPHMIATALCERGLGRGVELLLKRREPVPRSSGVSSSSARPEAQQHYDTIDVADQMYPPTSIILVDDVVTIGRTLMACALRLIDAFPNTRVVGFAAARSVRYTHLATVADMRRPHLSTYRMDQSGYIRHDPPH